MTRKFRVRINGQEYEVEVEEVGGAGQVPAAPSAGQAAQPSAPAPTRPVGPAPAQSQPTVAPAAGEGSVTAPLPGIILEILVQPGQAVAAGQVLCVLEAMKMENEITAPGAGTVQTVNVTKGAAVALGDVLVVIG